MPYIPQSKRRDIEMNNLPPTAPGELAFIFVNEAAAYLDTMGLSFQTISQVMGALECAKLEVYRRMAAPYEDSKKTSHGDLDTLRNVLYKFYEGGD